MVNECSELNLLLALENYFTQEAKDELREERAFEGRELHSFRIRKHEIETCLVQFRALGLIVQSERARSVKDTSTYWTLTSFGDYSMIQLRALRRPPAPRPEVKGQATPK